MNSILKTLIVVLILMATMISRGFARNRLDYNPNIRITGTVLNVDVNKHFIIIREEKGSRDKYTFYSNSKVLKKIEIGDRVRIYYRVGSSLANHMVKMTELKEKKNQNLGVVYKP